MDNATVVSATNQTPMCNLSVRFLIGYLLITTALTFYVVFSLWSAQPRADRVEAPKCSAGTTGPVLLDLYPNRVNVGSTASDVLIRGCGFPPATQVKFNGAQHPARVVDAGNIRLDLSSTDVAAAGTAVITLSSGLNDFGSAVLTIGPPAVYWQFLTGGPWTISQEVLLLLMVLFTGALGASVYALKSLADYQGDNKLYETWFTYYVIQPFTGAGAAFLLYLVVRGGFLGATSADLKTVNQFGICAIAGLAGAFSDIAFAKLREVFQTLFKPQDDRGGKLKSKFTTTVLPDGTVGKPYNQTLQAGGVTAPLKWSVTPPALPAGLTLDAMTGIISGTPKAVTSKAPYKFTVTDSATPAASFSIDLTLEIKPPAAGPKITTIVLPDGTVGKPYNQTLQADGVTAPLKWSVIPAELPAGLTLDAMTGIISGTPKAVTSKAPYKFTVTDSGTPAASLSIDLTLEIK